jgi:DNA-binding phage protein
MKTTPFEVQDYLKTPEERAAYLDAILRDDNADLIASLPGGNPTLDTLARITTWDCGSRL